MLLGMTLSECVIVIVTMQATLVSRFQKRHKTCDISAATNTTQATEHVHPSANFQDWAKRTG